MVNTQQMYPVSVDATAAVIDIITMFIVNAISQHFPDKVTNLKQYLSSEDKQHLPYLLLPQYVTKSHKFSLHLSWSISLFYKTPKSNICHTVQFL